MIFQDQSDPEQAVSECRLLSAGFMLWAETLDYL
jgi:hypothetical protein